MTRYRYQAYRRRQSSPVVLLAAGAASFVLASALTASHPGHATAAPASVASPPALTAAIPAASSYTPASWSRAFLRSAGYAATACNTAFVLAWIRAEGSQWAWRNPLDDELPEPGSRQVNETSPGHGVQAYAAWPSGLAATRFTLTGPDYSAIRAALRAGNDAQRGADAVAASPWGTEPFSASCRAN